MTCIIHVSCQGTLRDAYLSQRGAHSMQSLIFLNLVEKLSLFFSFFTLLVSPAY